MSKGGLVPTGYSELDILLLGGLPQTYAVALTSPLCNERDRLIRSFLETGVKKGEVVFHVAIDPGLIKSLAEEFPSNFYLFICNPQADVIIKDAPNVVKLKGGVENISEIGMTLTSAIRKLDPSLKGTRRICLGFVSEVLLQHQAVKTRHWLASLLTELKSSGFTTLAIFDPEMNPSEELHAVLALFDGEMDIYEKQTKRNLEKYLKIVRMSNFEYEESELPIKKEHMHPSETLQQSKVRPTTLGPSDNAWKMFEEYPRQLCNGWRNNIIDGAIEIISCPSGGNKYGGFEKNRITCHWHDEIEWPRDADLDDREERLKEFAKGLVGINDHTGWLRRERQKAAPNRIRTLLNAPADPVLDRTDLDLHFGNSDYFTVRTVTEISRCEREDTLGGLKLSDIFPARWAGSGQFFPRNCVPYHVSAQGVLVCHDPNTDKDYLIIAANNPRGRTLVYGWSATMAEQMWGPEPVSSFTPWWAPFTKDLGVEIKPRAERRGDQHIQDALIRGLREEFRLNAGEDYPSDPKLLSVCLEQDMYFITFIFFVPMRLPLMALRDKWFGAPDHGEFDDLAAYQIGGHDENGNLVDGPKKIASLLAQDRFDGGRYLIESPTDQPLVGSWHTSSRMRIYVAACHMWGSKMAEYVDIRVKEHGSRSF